MRRTITLSAVTLALAAAVACGCDGRDDKPVAPPDKTAAAPSASAPATAPATTPAATATTTAAPAPTESADAALAKKYDCGAKEQKPCPMQGWMKRVMATALSGGDGDKLSQALTYVAKHPPPGYPRWTELAQAGAGKAKAGDIDGAKASCKECHDLYKDNYKATMRDRAF